MPLGLLYHHFAFYVPLLKKDAQILFFLRSNLLQISTAETTEELSTHIISIKSKGQLANPRILIGFAG